MLSQLKPIVRPQVSQALPPLDQKGKKLADWILSKHPVGLGDNIFQEYELQKGNKTYKLTARGILEDFRVTLDEHLVLECTYDNLYHCNEELIDLILE